jgi:hypothetical protein
MSETPTPPTLEQRAEQITVQIAERCIHWRREWFSMEQAQELILSALQDVRAEGQRETKTEGLPGSDGPKSCGKGAPVAALVEKWREREAGSREQAAQILKLWPHQHEAADRLRVSADVTKKRADELEALLQAQSGEQPEAALPSNEKETQS